LNLQKVIFDDKIDETNKQDIWVQIYKQKFAKKEEDLNIKELIFYYIKLFSMIMCNFSHLNCDCKELQVFISTHFYHSFIQVIQLKTRILNLVDFKMKKFNLFIM